MKKPNRDAARKKSPLPYGVASRLARRHGVTAWHVAEVARKNRTGSEALTQDIEREIRHASGKVA